MSYVGFMVYNASAAEILAKEKDVTEVPYFAYGERERERERERESNVMIFRPY